VRAANIIVGNDKCVWIVDYEFAQIVSDKSGPELFERGPRLIAIAIDCD
jgi:hypothetical protein